MVCQNCGTQNREGELICKACSALIHLPATKELNFPSAGHGQQIDRPATDTFHSVTFEFDDLQIEFPVSGGRVILIGRGAVDQTRVEHYLDLLPMGGSEKGVSRRHAELRIENKTAYLVDLLSTNGTFLNGHRVSPENRHPLCTGDTIRFGALETRVRLA